MNTHLPEVSVTKAMAIFKVDDPQIVYLMTEGKFRYGGIPESELEVYRSFSSVEPIVVLPPSGVVNDTSSSAFFVPLMVDASASGTSLLVTKAGALRGRGTDHHCKSNVFRGIVEWMKSNLLGDLSDSIDNITAVSSEESKNKNVTNGPIRVVWSSRRPYCCRPPGKIYMPKRHIMDEEELLRRVGEALGTGYTITAVNFGHNMTARDSVSIASKSNVFVGVHGAGLMWAAFQPPHSGIVEIFGGDRASNNRHYHNIASLADMHYRMMKLGGSVTSLSWNQKSVDELANNIRSISMDLLEEPGN